MKAPLVILTIAIVYALFNRKINNSGNMNVFLVGATGGLGGHVMQHLLAKGAIVTAYVRSPEKMGDVGDKVKVVKGDLASVTSATLDGADVIVACHSSGPANERHKGYAALVAAAKDSSTKRIVGVGGAGQLLMEDGSKKQSEEGWYPTLKPVTEDHEKGLEIVRSSGVDFTWVAPAYMPNDADSSGGYIATNDKWNDVGVIPQIDVAEFVADEALAPKHLGHVVALSGKQ